MIIKYAGEIEYDVLGAYETKCFNISLELVEVRFKTEIIRYCIVIDGRQKHVYHVNKQLGDSERNAQLERAKEHFYILYDDTPLPIQKMISSGLFYKELERYEMMRQTVHKFKLSQEYPYF